MKLEEIRERAGIARKVLEQIKPKLKCEMVVVFNNVQFSEHDIVKASAGLVKIAKTPDIFLPGQNMQLLNQAVLLMEQVGGEIERLGTEIQRKETAAENKIWNQYEPLMNRAKREGNAMRLNQAVEECCQKREEVKPQASRKLKKELHDKKADIVKYRTDFETLLEGYEIHNANFELRFERLDMEKIQELKQHPAVLAVGKTDMSGASINVVIG
jgi:hypothetical protein